MKRLILIVLAIGLVACGEEGPGSPTEDPAPNRNPIGSGLEARDKIEYFGVVWVMESFPVQLMGEMRMTNIDEADAQLIFPDGCVVLLRAYTPTGNTPVWDQAQDVACTQATVEVNLAPAAARTFSTATSSAADILGATLPDGTYRITVYARPNDGIVEIDVGTVALGIPR